MPNLCIIPARALEDRTLSWRELRALLAVGYYTNHAGKGVWASQATMADRAGMSRAHMNESLQSLAEKGYLVKRQRTGTTCLIDILLDPPSGQGVPVVGTGGVPTAGTGGVPTAGTQTTQLTTQLHDDSDSLAISSKATVTLSKLPEEYRVLVGDVLARHRNATALVAELEALNSGLHGAYPWEIIGRAVHELAAAGGNITPRAIRAFCEGVKAPPSPERGRGGTRGTPLDFEALKRRLDDAP